MGARFIVGDVLEVLPTLEAGSVDLVLTSPPFLALRSYLPADHPDKSKEGGSQPTPGAFIDWLVDVVEALDRVLAPHGSMVIELGDTYTGARGYGTPEDAIYGERHEELWATAKPARQFKKDDDGWPASKSLALIPELFRMTLVYGFNPLTGRQTRRWRLRNVIRWVRPNPPVGALGDKFRPATSELMVFCRTDEAGRRRYFDLDAVREPHRPHRRLEAGALPEKRGSKWDEANAHRVSTDYADTDTYTTGHPAGAPPLDWWNIPLLDGEEETPYGPGEKPKAHARTAKGVESAPRSAKSADRGGNWATLPELHETRGSPPLDWWEIPPGGYQGAHYAVFPEALCVKPIKSMCPERVCRRCGEPSKRIVDAHRLAVADNSTRLKKWANPRSGFSEDVPEVGWEYERNTLGFTDCEHHCPSCNGDQEEFCSTCNGTGSSYRPGLVLDPFAGSGTTLAVAVGHGRDALGIDLDERNLELARGRLGMFLEAAV